MPRELITTEGEAAWIGKTTLWGEIEEEHEHKEYGTDCKLRFPGQWYDEESKLCYNWHRYYDPETARYVSPDPIGLAGGPNNYAYVHNPLAWCDPFGLQKTRVGRWMSPEEYETMKDTGQVQEGSGGITHAATSGADSFRKQAPPGSVYVEFDVPSKSLLKGGQDDWVFAVSPNATNYNKVRLGKQGGEFNPPATDISGVLGTK